MSFVALVEGLNWEESKVMLVVVVVVVVTRGLIRLIRQPAVVRLLYPLLLLPPPLPWGFIK